MKLWLGTRCAVLCCLVIGALPTPLAAQEKPPEKPAATTPVPKPEAAKAPAFVVDLSGPTVKSYAVDPGTYRIVLYNAIPGMKYAIRSGAVEMAQQPVVVLPTGSAVGLIDLPNSADLKSCLAALADTKSLLTAAREADVPALEQKIRANIAGCGKEELTYVSGVLAQTVYETELEVQIPDDARRTLTVARQGLEWNVTMTTLARGRLQTLFGWMFAPNHDEAYFSDSIGDNKFAVKPRLEDDGALTNLPAVLFTWLPTSQAFSNVQHGPTMGLGVTLGSDSRPAFLGGYMIRWNQNYGVAVGLAVYPHQRLDGKYTVDQVLTTSLEPNQLNRDALKVNFFVGGVIRFGTDPRKEIPEKPAAGGEKAAAPKTGGK